MKKLMQLISKLVPLGPNNENSLAVKFYNNIFLVKDFFVRKQLVRKNSWPLVGGNYIVVNPSAQIAVCTLTSDNLFESIEKFEKVTIVGSLYTPNLGIEKIILNTISNPNIRYLLLCGKDSPIFQPGQAIRCLFDYGITPEKRIVNAIGHYPVLQNLSIDKINHFLEQIILIDKREVVDTNVLFNNMETLESKKPYSDSSNAIKVTNVMDKEVMFTSMKPIGKRIPLDYDENGFFVITINSARNEIIVKHYYKDNRPGFIIKSHSSDAILRAIIDNNLISQMSHAAYLGAELTKAKIALKHKLIYIQDQSLQEKIK